MPVKKSARDRPVCGLRSALRAENRFLIRVSFFLCKGKEHFAGLARANFKIGDAAVVNFRGQEEFNRIVSNDPSIAKLDKSEPIVEPFKNGFLAPPIEEVTEYKHGLALTFNTEVFEGVLRRRCAGIVA